MKSFRSQQGKRSRAMQEQIESRDRWLISYADLVTLLLALFIVLYAAADHERAASSLPSAAAVRDDTPLTPTRFEGIAEIATGGDTGLRAPLSITRLEADCWYRRPLGCH